MGRVFAFGEGGEAALHMCRMSRGGGGGGGGDVPGVGIRGAGCPVGVASYYSAGRASGVDGIKMKEGPTFQKNASRRLELQPKGRCWMMGSHERWELARSSSDREDPRAVRLAGDAKMMKVS